MLCRNMFGERVPNPKKEPYSKTAHPVSPFVTWVDTELDDLWASGLEDTRKVMLQRLGMELLASVIFRLEDVKIHHLWYAADAHIF